MRKTHCKYKSTEVARSTGLQKKSGKYIETRQTTNAKTFFGSPLTDCLWLLVIAVFAFISTQNVALNVFLMLGIKAVEKLLHATQRLLGIRRLTRRGQIVARGRGRAGCAEQACGRLHAARRRALDGAGHARLQTLVVPEREREEAEVR